MFIQLKIH